MCGQIVLLTAVLGGINAGWEPLPEGGVQYLIQIDPGLLESRGPGESLESYIPPGVQDVRAVRITVGTGPLPRELPAEPAAEPEDESWSPTQPKPRLDPPAPASDPPLSGPATDPLAANPISSTPPPPNTFVPSPNGRPIGTRPAGYEEPLEAATTAPELPLREPESTAAEKPSLEEEPRNASRPADETAPGKPWWPLTFAFFGLFASLGVNGFLLWIVADFRVRYRSLLRRMGDLGAE